MAFDGIAVAALTEQFKNELLEGRIQKIAQPESDEINILIKGAGGNRRLLLSANPSLPIAYLTEENKPSPITAPSFLMVLRKHLSGGKIISVSQPSMERCISFKVRHFDEMGDERTITLLIEIMGKHSNIILVDEENIIIDAIRRIPAHLSSVREVIPGKPYFLPDPLNKLDPLNTSKEAFLDVLDDGFEPASKWIVNRFAGISPQISSELLLRSGIDEREILKDISPLKKYDLADEFVNMMAAVRSNDLKARIYYDDERPVDFSLMPLKLYESLRAVEYDDISLLIAAFYRQKEKYSRINSRSADLRHVVSVSYARAQKKLSIQKNQEKDTKNREKYRIYGELLQAFGYNVEPKSRSITVKNYYDNDNELTIPLDPMLSAQENAARYFKKYNKLKRTKEALTIQIKETMDEIDRLESVKASLETSETEADLEQIRDELTQLGYIRYKKTKNKKSIKASPLVFENSDGFKIYVGKNNTQNDELTNHFASKNDLWFHVKSFHGSHVILKTDSREVPDELYVECAKLAAYYSAARGQNKVEVDYVRVKELKKVKSAAPGFVIYHTNYSITVKPEIPVGLNSVYIS